MTKQRMVPVELLERILSITLPIAPAMSAEIRAIISGPGVDSISPDGVVEALQSLKEQIAAIVCHKLGHPGTAMAVQEAVIRLINRALAAIPQPTANAQPSVVACPLVNDPEGRN